MNTYFRSMVFQNSKILTRWTGPKSVNAYVIAICFLLVRSRIMTIWADSFGPHLYYYLPTYLLWCKSILHDAIVNVISFQFSVLFWDPDRLALGVACDDILSDYIVPGHDDTGTVPRAEKGLHVLGQQKSSCCMCPVHIIKSRTINVCDGAVTQKGSTISQVCPDNS